jgi:hypothetical protein
MPISESYNPINDPTLNPLARRGGDIIKRFVQPASSVSGGGNGVTSLDDPTYLGFSLRFDISSPLFNGATNGTPAKPPSETPLLDAVVGAAAGNGLAPAIGQPSLGGEVGNNIPGGESAIGYLQRVGETTRASYLASFIQGLREVNEYRPYYWQTIEGLTDAWTKSMSMIDPYQGAAEGEGITIGCLEAVDLKISALFNLYRAAVYDAEYRRMVLPKNLMYFKVYVDVYEIRRFKATEGWLTKLNPAAPPPDVDRFLNDNTSKITFIFDECVWMPDVSGKIFESVTNAGGNEMGVTSIKWQYGSISMESDFAGIDQQLSDAAKLQTQGNLGSAVKNAIKNQATKAANAALARGVGAVRALAQGTLLGNVFGLRNQILGALQNPGAVSAAIAGAFNTPGRPPVGQRLADNALGEGIQPGNSLPSGNLFVGQIPNTESNLPSSNIFGTGPSGPPPLESNNVFG